MLIKELSCVGHLESYTFTTQKHNSNNPRYFQNYPPLGFVTFGGQKTLSSFQFKSMLLPHGELFTSRPCCPCMVDRKVSSKLVSTLVCCIIISQCTCRVFNLKETFPLITLTSCWKWHRVFNFNSTKSSYHYVPDTWWKSYGFRFNYKTAQHELMKHENLIWTLVSLFSGVGVGSLLSGEGGIAAFGSSPLSGFTSGHNFFTLLLIFGAIWWNFEQLIGNTKSSYTV